MCSRRWNWSRPTGERVALTSPIARMRAAGLRGVGGNHHVERAAGLVFTARDRGWFALEVMGERTDTAQVATGVTEHDGTDGADGNTSPRDQSGPAATSLSRPLQNRRSTPVH